MAPSRGKGGQKYKGKAYENVHANLILVLLFIHNKVGCRKELYWNKLQRIILRYDTYEYHK